MCKQQIKTARAGSGFAAIFNKVRQTHASLKWNKRTPPKVEALNSTKSTTTTRENRVCFVFFAERKQKVAANSKDS